LIVSSESVPVLPKGGPVIDGGKQRYSLGDTVDLNCTSTNSKPAADLFWSINGEPVSYPSRAIFIKILLDDMNCLSGDTKSVVRQRLKLFNFCCPTKFGSSDMKLMLSDSKMKHPTEFCT
jgi:hypothetical protein